MTAVAGGDGLVITENSANGNQYLTVAPSWRSWPSLPSIPPWPFWPQAPTIERDQPYTDFDLRFTYSMSLDAREAQYIALAPRYVNENNQVRIELHPGEIRIINKRDADDNGILEVDTVDMFEHANTGFPQEAFVKLYDDQVWMWTEYLEEDGIDWDYVTTYSEPVATGEAVALHSGLDRVNAAQKLRITLGALGYSQAYFILDDIRLTSLHLAPEIPALPEAVASDVIINELQSWNTATLMGENDQYSPWIELYNRGGSAVDLHYWSLTDDPKNPGKWRFPEVTLQPGEYRLVFATGVANGQPDSPDDPAPPNYIPTFPWTRLADSWRSCLPTHRASVCSQHRRSIIPICTRTRPMDSSLMNCPKPRASEEAWPLAGARRPRPRDRPAGRIMKKNRR